jgi:predicted ATP-binding protein involved in virulence
LGDLAAFETPGVVLIDEVDMHLHPTWQQVVLASLREAFPAIQFIVTTHSPQVLTSVPKENIRIIMRSDDGEWSAEMPTFSPLAKEAGDALAYVFGTDPRPDLPVLQNLYRFEELVRAGQGHSSEAREYLQRLSAAGFEFSDSEIRLLELQHKKFGEPHQSPLF